MPKLIGMQGLWFLGQDFFESCVDAYSRFEFDQARYEAFIERHTNTKEPRFLENEGVAHIPILGPLTKAPDFFFDIFGDGSTVYGDIVEAILAAEGDENIKSIILEIDSPGGEVGGFFETAAAIAGTTKPVEAHVTDMAASGAFGLAAQADRIVINNAMAMVGSVGVVTTRFVSEFRVQVRSTEAPNKAPDASTQEGVDAIRLELDAIHTQFAGLIATGRGVTIDTVNEDFGRGGMLIAADALQARMIDAIGTPSFPGGPTPSEPIEARAKTMTEEEFKAAHPALYAAIQAASHAVGVTAGIQTGVDQERDRVNAHLKAGESFKCMEIAAKHIASGESFSSQTVQAEYMTAGRNAADSTNAAGDAAVVDDKLKGAGTDGKSSSGTSDADTLKAETAVFDQLDDDLGVAKPKA